MSAEVQAQIGEIERDGDHKGEIYGGIWSRKKYGSDNRPIWFLTAPRPMNHFDAAAWAKGQGGALPTRKQGDYLTTLKGKGGAFTELFSPGGSFPAGMIWLADTYSNGSPCTYHQQLIGGAQMHSDHKLHVEVPVLSVRR